jgi:hypothetical protein
MPLKKPVVRQTSKISAASHLVMAGVDLVTVKDY